MSEFGLKIKNIKAATLFGYNNGIRNRYDYTDAMFSNSLFSKYIIANGLNVWKEESTRDIVCFEFDFGTRDYQEEMNHLQEMLEECKTETEKQNVIKIIENVENNKGKYIKLSKEEIRSLFYKEGVYIDYISKDKDGNIKKCDRIYYRMLYRSSAKAKLGQVMFINAKLYNKAYDWLTMGLGHKMPYHNAKIVEMSAYAPLTTSTIVGEIHIPVENIVILKDQDSFFKTMAKIVKAEEYTKEVKKLDEISTDKNRQKALENKNYNENGSLKYKKVYKTEDKIEKKCVIEDAETDVKNTLWDGMGLVESAIFPSWCNGMMLIRNHFFKMCGFKTNMQLFFKDWCKKTGNDYDTYEISDMFGIKHRLKDIKVLTTDNAIKWKKFIDIMGGTLPLAYQYWCERINADGSMFGIVKTDHPSKLGNSTQQMSYQMINTLPCSKLDIDELASGSVSYVEKMKFDNDEFERFLRMNSTEVNHYKMMIDLYENNKDFAESEWFRKEKSNIIKNYVDRLRKGKITVNADNLTVCGNPYGLLMYAVGENWHDDPTLNYENGTIQCYTTLFNDGEYICGIRNPHNSPNNVGYLHNKYSPEMKKYFPFSNNIIAVNCIQSDIQSRLNGMDFDSDFIFATNNRVMVNAAKKCYSDYPTIVNALNESGITYNNDMQAYADMDNKFAKSRLGIGWSSNLSQLAMTYYWTSPSKELYDNFVILSVLAQVIIDGCKREYEVDGMTEIKRIKALDCMNRYIEVKDENGKVKKKNYDYPYFMKFVKEIKYTKNGKEIEHEKIKQQKQKIKDRIDASLLCPMNWLQTTLNGIKVSSKTDTIPTENFIVNVKGKADSRQISKIRKMVQEYDIFVSNNYNNEDAEELIQDKFNELVDNVSKIKIGDIKTINRLIEIGFGINTSKNDSMNKKSKTLLNCLYKANREKFIKNFKKNAETV